jgi:hypothetical protein
MNEDQSKISNCIRHWQVKHYISLCLRSIRKHSQKYDLEVIVVDNGSRDESLDYLRSLPWIHLIERPEETHTNWPTNVFTAWDCGIQHASGTFFVSMHSDVFIKADGWLDPMLREINHDSCVAGAGAWKLHMENKVYTFQKRLIGFLNNKIKKALGLRKKDVTIGYQSRGQQLLQWIVDCLSHQTRIITGRDRDPGARTQHISNRQAYGGQKPTLVYSNAY